MKLCILSGSPHRHGNTRTLVDSYTEGARSVGHEAEVFDVVRMDIHPCMGCMACKKKAGGCIQRDDMDKIYTVVKEASVLVFATPMYWWNMSGPLKTAIDRLFALPFNIRMDGHCLEGKKLRILVTSGQPAAPELQSELESLGQKMCNFTGMHWLGILSGGDTAAIPICEQPEVLENAFHAGRTDVNVPMKDK